jgi:hypothetical protein
MYQREFDNLLRNTPPRAMLFYGDNAYLLPHIFNTILTLQMQLIHSLTSILMSTALKEQKLTFLKAHFLEEPTFL